MSLRRWFGIVMLICAVAGTAAADDWSKKYAVSGKPTLRVESNDGHVEVDTWDRKEVEARVTTKGWTIGLTGVRISESQTGDRVSLQVRVPHFQWSLGTREHSVMISLMVPREADLSAETGDGHVTVRSLAGKIEVRTGDGHIQVTSSRGEMRLRTGDGHIEGDNLDGKLEAQTGDGRVRVNGRFDGLDLRTNDGSIEAEAKPGSKIETEWYVSSGDGSVRLRLPGSFGAELDAHTGDGRITVDFPITVAAGAMSRSSVRGKMNGGGQPLRVQTGDGSIRIDRL